MQGQADPIDEERRELERQREAKVEREQWEDDLRWMMEDRRGRRIMWRLLGEAGVYRTVFSESHAVSSLLEGKRQIGLFLVDEVQSVCPQEYDRMKIEQRKHARPDAAT